MLCGSAPPGHRGIGRCNGPRSIVGLPPQLRLGRLEEARERRAEAVEIKAKIRTEFNITGSIGIASSRTISKMAAKARKPDGLLVLGPGEAEGFLKGLPVEKITGVGPHKKQYLNEMCVFTVGELAERPLERLVKRFGKVGDWLFQVVRGRDGDEVGFWRDPPEPPKSVGHSYTLEREVRRRPDVEAWIRLLCEMVAHRLRRQGLEARCVHLYIRGSTESFSREKRFRTATDDPEEICRRALVILESFGCRSFCMRGLGVSTSGLTSSDGLMLFDADRKRQQLLTAMDPLIRRTSALFASSRAGSRPQRSGENGPSPPSPKLLSTQAPFLCAVMEIPLPR
jgi:DNA polymerase-4